MAGAYADGSGTMPAMVYLYVDDADAAYQRELDAGATSVEAPNDAEYGDRRAAVEDPCSGVPTARTMCARVLSRRVYRAGGPLV